MKSHFFLSVRAMKLTAWVTCLAVLVLVGCQSPGEKPSAQAGQPLRVIFETDMGNDVDDALALDMLYKYLDTGKINLLAISNNKNSVFSIPFLQIMNNWYGYPDIPLGNVTDGANSQGDSRDYAQAVYEHKANGQRVFKDYAGDSTKVKTSVALYRQILSQQPDTSVIIISVGFSTNIARLLDSEADDASPLSGKELVAKKVKLLSMMAGNFDGKLGGGEYNVIKDTLAAKKVFSEWPTAIVTSPFEVGIAILYPATSIENDFKFAAEHPLVVAYKSYLDMPYDRPTWDLTSVLYAVEGNEQNYFGVSEPGIIDVAGKGKTNFTPDPAGKHRYLSVDSIQVQKIKSRFISLITKKPANHEKQ